MVEAPAGSRPRSADGWEPSWGALFYVWSTPAWDWAAGVIHGDLNDDTIPDLHRMLHPGEPVDRQRRIDKGPRSQRHRR